MNETYFPKRAFIKRCYLVRAGKQRFIENRVKVLGENESRGCGRAAAAASELRSGSIGKSHYHLFGGIVLYTKCRCANIFLNALLVCYVTSHAVGKLQN